MAEIFGTYDLQIGPLHVPDHEFAEQSNQQYRQLLSTDPAEPEVQAFLEKHPWLVPGHSTPGVASGHYPLHCALITQPRLPGQDIYIPDFMWIATHSGAWFPTLVEIERPGKRIFNRDGTPSADFSKARNQLNQWRSWFNESTNVEQFLRTYGIPEFMLKRTRRLHMILIYGRRSEFEGNPKLTHQRGSLLPGQDEELMSFDRLMVDTSLRDAITVKSIGHGRYRAIWIPPVFETGPSLAERLLCIEGISEAIDTNPEFDADRKVFLKRRIPYWREWASSPGGKGYNTGHRE